MNYLITGATGGFGAAALNHLKEIVAAEEIFALARTEEKAQTLKEAGFNVRIGDYSDATSLEKAFAGIDRLLFVSGAPGNRQAEHKNVVDAAKKAGVSYLAYTSFASVDTSTSALAVDHFYTEGIIKESNIAHTFLRNNWYLENELPIVGAALSGGKFVYSAGEGKAGWALRRDYAEVAAKAVAGNEYPEILELSAPTITYAELAEAVKKATGKDFEVVSADENGFITNLVADGLPEEVAQVLQVFQTDIKNGVLDIQSNDFEKALGRPLTSLVDGIKELLG